MLEQKYIDNLTKLRDWLVANRELVENRLDFRHYVHGTRIPINTFFISHPNPEHITSEFMDTITECNTSCCALGWAAVSNLFFNEVNDWDDFSLRAFGIHPFDSSTGEYLFDTKNPPDFDYMIQRFNFVIANGTAPLSFHSSDDDEDCDDD